MLLFITCLSVKFIDVFNLDKSWNLVWVQRRRATNGRKNYFPHKNSQIIRPRFQYRYSSGPLSVGRDLVKTNHFFKVPRGVILPDRIRDVIGNCCARCWAHLFAVCLMFLTGNHNFGQWGIMDLERGWWPTFGFGEIGHAETWPWKKECVADAVKAPFSHELQRKRNHTWKIEAFRNHVALLEL